MSGGQTRMLFSSGVSGRTPNSSTTVATTWLELFAGQFQAFEATHEEARHHRPVSAASNFEVRSKELTGHDLGLQPSERRADAEVCPLSDPECRVRFAYVKALAGMAGA
jgi:hypothetical protein